MQRLRLMALIDNLGKIYYCPLKINRLVDKGGGVKKYQKLEELKWNELELVSGKIIKIKGFPRDQKVRSHKGYCFYKLQQLGIATNDLNYQSTDDVEFEILAQVEN